MNEPNSVPVARPVEPSTHASPSGPTDLVDRPGSCIDREATDPAGGIGEPACSCGHAPVTAAPVTATPVRHEGQPLALLAARGSCAAPEHVKTDPLAIASAACGFMGIVPIVMQVIGLALGAASLIRIRRAKRKGLTLKGSRWATTGIVTSAFALICWVGVFAALNTVSSSISGSTNSLDSLLKTGAAAQHTR